MSAGGRIGDFDLRANGGANLRLIDADGIKGVLDHPVVAMAVGGLISACIMVIASGKSFDLKAGPFSLRIA